MYKTEFSLWFRLVFMIIIKIGMILAELTLQLLCCKVVVYQGVGCSVMHWVPLGFMNGSLARLGRPSLTFVWGIFFRRTFLSVRIATTKLLDLNFNKELYRQELRNNNLILLYVLLFWKILVEECDPFIVNSGLKRKRFQGTEQCEAALVPVTVLLNLYKGVSLLNMLRWCLDFNCWCLYFN